MMLPILSKDSVVVWSKYGASVTVDPETAVESATCAFGYRPEVEAWLIPGPPGQDDEDDAKPGDTTRALSAAVAEAGRCFTLHVGLKTPLRRYFNRTFWMVAGIEHTPTKCLSGNVVVPLSCESVRETFAYIRKCVVASIPEEGPDYVFKLEKLPGAIPAMHKFEFAPVTADGARRFNVEFKAEMVRRDAAHADWDMVTALWGSNVFCCLYLVRRAGEM